MVEYRGHTSVGQILRTLGLIAAVVAVAGFNAFQIYSGLTAGLIEDLSRGRGLTSFEAEPGWFLFNVVFRTVATVVFVGAAAVFWKQRLRPELEDF